MRCIEIIINHLYKVRAFGLTLTWDVLKYELIVVKWLCVWININMRCIEIYTPLTFNLIVAPININMRCIEINITQSAISAGYRLTLTWDVLKCKEEFARVNGALD